MQNTSLGSNQSVSFGIQNQIITKLCATDSFVNTEKGLQVFSCNQYC